MGADLDDGFGAKGDLVRACKSSRGGEEGCGRGLKRRSSGSRGRGTIGDTRARCHVGGWGVGNAKFVDAMF